MRGVSIVIPYIRPDLIEKARQLAVDNADYAPIQIVSERDTEFRGVFTMLNYLIAKTKYDFVFPMCEESEAQPGYLREAMTTMGDFPGGWGLVLLSRGVHLAPGRVVTGPKVMSKKLLPYLGGPFYHEGYKHSRGDWELVERAALLKRYALCNSGVVLHTNRKDEHYEKHYRTSWVEHDRALFKERKGGGWAPVA
jgi:hypothetical protein